MVEYRKSAHSVWDVKHHVRCGAKCTVNVVECQSNPVKMRVYLATASGISSVPIFCDAKSRTPRRTKIFPEGRSNCIGT